MNALIVITLAISACNMPSSDKVQAKLAELQKANPTAQVKLKVDQRCLKAQTGQFNSKL